MARDTIKGGTLFKGEHLLRKYGNYWVEKNHRHFLFVAQVNSSELGSLDSSSFPENIAPIFKKLRRKEKTLRLKSQELENKLEMSETACYTLAEENSDLKTAIESLETEILEVRY